MKGVNRTMTALQESSDAQGVYPPAGKDLHPTLREAVGHLADISTALHSISYELERLRLVLGECPAKYTSIHTREGDITFPEWVNRPR
jgi:hypothetical protein